MVSLGTDMLERFMPAGADLMITATAKQNRRAVLMAGVGVLLLAVAYAKIDWLGSGEEETYEEEIE